MCFLFVVVFLCLFRLMLGCCQFALLFFSVFPFLPSSFPLFLSCSLSLFLFISSFCVSLSLSLCLFSLFLSLSICLSVSLSLSLCFFCVCVSLYFLCIEMLYNVSLQFSFHALLCFFVPSFFPFFQ